MKRLLLIVIFAATAMTISAIGDGKTYRIVSKKYPVRSLFVTDSKRNSNVDIVLWTETNVPSQQWTVVENTDGSHLLQNVYSGQYAVAKNNENCSALRTNSLRSKAPLKIVALDESAGTYLVLTADSTLSLSATDDSDGSMIVWAEIDASDNAQQWVFEETEPKTEFTAAMRDEMLSAYIQRHLHTRDDGYRTFYDGGWGEAEQLEVLLDAYETTGNEYYLTLAKQVYAYFNSKVGSDWTGGASSGYHWYGYDFNDDVMWMVIAVARLGLLSGDNTLTEAARSNFDRIYSRAYIPFTGLLRWAEQSGDRYGTNSCINGPAEVAACYLGKSGCGEEYYEKARALYAAQRQHLTEDMATGKVWDSVVWDWVTTSVKSKNEWASTYNQGTMLGAACLLYSHYGEEQYKSDAKKIMAYTVSELCDSYGIIRVCQDPTNQDLSGFKGILMRYVRMLITDLDQTTRLEWMQRNALRAYCNRDASGLTGTGWLTKSTESATSYPFGCSTAASAAANVPFPPDTTSHSGTEANDTIVIASPGGRIVLRTIVNAQREAVYKVMLDGKEVVGESRLGLVGRSRFDSCVISSDSVIDESYTLPHGKQSTFINHCHEVLVSYRGTSNDDAALAVRFRVYDDAVAFRYEMDRAQGLSSFTGETTEFTFPDINKVLALEYSYDYTWYYNQRSWEDMTYERGYNEPILVQTGKDNVCVLISEAAHYAETAGNAIVRGSGLNQFKLRQADRDGFISSTPITYPATGCWHTPWRVMIIGQPNEIVESTVISNLNPPSTFDDWDWIRPGRVAWNWAGEDRHNTGDIGVAKRYADLAQYLGWEYVLIDDGWEGSFSLGEFVSYATEHGVDVIVWYNNNHFQSDYSNCLTEFRRLAKLGVKGVKIDFFESDAKDVIAKYEILLRAAAEAKLMIDFHGCTRPTGWERTYPNLMTMEAVLGGEFLLGEPHMNQADHAANLVVGRNVLGAMDFTPTKLAQRTGSVKTHSNTDENPFCTWSYQLALWTLFESSFQCLIDCPDNIIDSPIEPALRVIPTTWDETRCLEIQPSSYATLARRSGNDWYVATVSKQSRRAYVKLDFLPEGHTYYAYIYQDGKCQFDIAFQKKTVTAATTLAIAVKANGGATVILSTNPNLPMPRGTVYEAETKAKGGDISANDHCSGGQYRKAHATDKNITFRYVKAEAEGEYALTLFYWIDDTADQAYIQVGDDGEKQFFQMHTRDDYDQRKGLYVAMKTVYIHLHEGTNTIIYGGIDAMPPALDRITVTPTPATADIIDGVETECESESKGELSVDGGTIICRTFAGGTLSIYSLDGRLLERYTVQAGEVGINPFSRGIIIASLSTGVRCFSLKIEN